MENSQTRPSASRLGTSLLQHSDSRGCISFSERSNVPPCRPAICYSPYLFLERGKWAIQDPLRYKHHSRITDLQYESEEDPALEALPSVGKRVVLSSEVITRLRIVFSPFSSHRQTVPSTPPTKSRPQAPVADIESCTIDDLTLPKQHRLTTVDVRISERSEITEPTPASSNLTASAHAPEGSLNRSQPLLQPKLLVDALGESSVMLLEDMSNIVGKIPGPPALKNAIGATLGVCAGALLYAFPAHSLGALGTLSVFAALGFEKNHHGRAQGIVGGILWSAHFVAMDVPYAAICAIFSTARTLFQAMLPEDRTRARATVAALGFGVAYEYPLAPKRRSP